MWNRGTDRTTLYFTGTSYVNLHPSHRRTLNGVHRLGCSWTVVVREMQSKREVRERRKEDPVLIHPQDQGHHLTSSLASEIRVVDTSRRNVFKVGGVLLSSFSVCDASLI